MELYYNEDHTKYAILVSYGYGSAWSADYGKALAYDKRVIEWYLQHDNAQYWHKLRDTCSQECKDARAFFQQLGYEYIYFGGLRCNMIEWMPVGSIWRINEYDGAESIEMFNIDNWVHF